MPDIPVDMVKSSLDSTLLSLTEDELAFFKAQTGIKDVEQLRQHILRVQAEAYETYPYPCIRRFMFTHLWITQLPNYAHVLELGKSRKNAIFIDVGCCFGHDIRAAIADGYPLSNMVALDLRRGLWNFGYKLFNATPESFPVPFVEGDIFDSAVLDMSPTSRTPTSSAPSLHELGNSLNALRGHVSIIHTIMLFHLFQEDQQLELAQRLAALLSPLPGSMLFGRHIGLAEPGFHTNNLSGLNMFCHSPESWCAMWDGVVFQKGTVEVNAELVLSDAIQAGKLDKEDPTKFHGRDTNERWHATKWLSWSVKRI